MQNNKKENKIVLIVDDNPDITELVVQMLEDRITLIPIVALTCKDAIEHLRNSSVALVITDFQIPRGREGGIISMTAKAKDPSIKVIVLSGLNQEIVKTHCEADVFLSKPFEMGDLLNAVRECGF